MKTQNIQNIRKLVSFPEDLYQVCLNQATKSGLSFDEYVQKLLTKEVKNKVNLANRQEMEVEIASPELEKEIGEAMADFKAGRYITIKNSKELKQYFDSL